MRKIPILTKEATEGSSDTVSQNQRRHQAIQDGYNAVSLAIVLLVLFDEGLPPIDHRLMFNSDKSSSLFNEAVKLKVLSNHGVKDQLDEQNSRLTLWCLIRSLRNVESLRRS